MDFAPIAFLTLLAGMSYAIGAHWKNPPYKLLCFGIILSIAFFTWNGLVITEPQLSQNITTVSSSLTTTTTQVTQISVKNSLTDSIALIYMLVGITGAIIELMQWVRSAYNKKGISGYN